MAKKGTTPHGGDDGEQQGNKHDTVNADPHAPGATTGGTRQGGPLSGDPAAARAATTTTEGGAGLLDVIANVRAFIAAVRARDVGGAAKALGALLQAFAEAFGGGDLNLFGTVNPAEYDRAVAELNTLRGEAGGFAHEFRNPSYHAQGGAASGAAPGMAHVPATAGISPTDIMAFIELARMVLEWFRKRNRGE